MADRRRIETWFPTEGAWAEALSYSTRLDSVESGSRYAIDHPQAELGDLDQEQRQELLIHTDSCANILASMEKEGHPLLALQAGSIVRGYAQYSPLFILKVALNQSHQESGGLVASLIQAYYLVDQTVQQHGLELAEFETDFAFCRQVNQVLKQDLEDCCAIHASI